MQQNSWHFAENILKYLFFNEMFLILYSFSLKFVGIGADYSLVPSGNKA